MGLFDRFRKKPAGAPAPSVDPETEDASEHDEDEGGSLDETTLYSATESSSIPFPDGDELVWDPGAHAGHLLHAVEVDILRRCHSFETLADHARAITTNLHLDQSVRDVAKGTLAKLRDLKLLVCLSDVRAAAAAATKAEPAPAPIRTVGVVTCDRPEAAERCLRGHITRDRAAGRKVEYILCDDSRDPATRKRNRAAAAALGKELGVAVRYAGLDEKRAYAAALAKAGVARELCDFALLDPEEVGFTAGANRNALLLDTLGERVFSADDDTTGRSGPGHDADDGLRLFTGDNPTEMWFYPDREQALASVELGGDDALAAHEALLGRSPAACLVAARDLDLDEASGRLVRLASEGRGRVLCTAEGLVGDSGMDSTAFYLFARGPTHDRLVADYPALRATREVARSCSWPTLSEGGFLMAPALGLDNTVLLPPFFPAARNEDGVAAVAMRLIWEDGLLGHLPRVVEHAPPARQGDLAAALRSLTTQRLSDVVIQSMVTCGFGVGGDQPADRARSLGRHLVEVGSLAPKAFADLLGLRRWQRIANHLGNLTETQRLYEDADHPDWEADVDAAMTAMKGSLLETGLAAPADLVSKRDPAAAHKLAARLIARYGALLEGWADLRAAALRLRESGVRLSVPA
jgi:hypothetical protein